MHVHLRKEKLRVLIFMALRKVMSVEVIFLSMMFIKISLIMINCGYSKSKVVVGLKQLKP